MLMMMMMMMIVIIIIIIIIVIIIVSNGNRTEWSPIRSVIIRVKQIGLIFVKTKSDDRVAGVRFV